MQKSAKKSQKLCKKITSKQKKLLAHSEELWYSTQAVSYTHLDVYKRQVFHMAETGVAVAIDEPISNEAFDKAELAMDECPTSAIHSKED